MRSLCVFLCLCWCSGTLGALPAPLRKALGAQKIPTSAVSLHVQALGATEPLLALNAAQPRSPASVAKLMTTLAALELLGPAYKWETEVYALGLNKAGVLHGDLLLSGRGDPFLVEERVWKLVGAIRRRGVQHITGDLLIDASYFTVERVDPGAFDGQPYRLYNVLPSAMMFNFKALEFHLVPNSATKRVTIHTIPNLPNLTIVNQLKASRSRCAGVNAHITMVVPDPVKADKIVFTGNYPRSCGERKLFRTALQTDTYTYGLFKAYWQQWGGVIDGSVRTAVAPVQEAPLLRFESPPLAEIIRPLNKWSNNAMADALFYTLGGVRFDPPLNATHAAIVISEYFAEQKIPTQGLRVTNGSGLSRDTRVSAMTLAAVLQRAWRSPFMPEFISALPIVGHDGTMRRRFRRRDESGRMHIKTGRLNGVSSIAGYVDAASGKRYGVVLMINHPNVHRGPGTVIQNAVLSWLYDQ